MNEFIALLRGINVSGKKKIKMAELRHLIENLGLKAVETYIQSGNIVFKSDVNDTVRLADLIKSAIQKHYGFDVPVWVKSSEDLLSIFRLNPFMDPSDLVENRIYFVLLQSVPDPSLMTALQKEVYPNEHFVVTDHCVYLSCQNGYGNAKLNNNLLERKLKVAATTRNFKTIATLLELSEKRK